MIKQFLRDNRLVRLFDSDPFLFWDCLADVQLVAFHTVFTLYHSAGIERIVQDTAHGAVRPQTVQIVRGRVLIVHALLTLVGRWIGDALLIQPLCNAKHAHSGEKPVENIADNGGGRLVDEQAAVVIRVLAIAVGRERADEFALSALQIK